MCGPFSAWMNLNYIKMPEKEAEAKMTDALKHLAFSIELCREQQKAGRFFVFEHPAGAASWATKVVRALEQDPSVERVVFDFCSLGMRSTYEDGSWGPARSPQDC